MIANSKKPMRMKLCSTNALVPTLSSERMSKREAIQPLTPRMKTKDCLENIDAIDMPQPTTEPITVAMAAPRVPSSGKPKLPPISR